MATDRDAGPALSSPSKSVPPLAEAQLTFVVEVSVSLERAGRIEGVDSVDVGAVGVGALVLALVLLSLLKFALRGDAFLKPLLLGFCGRLGGCAATPPFAVLDVFVLAPGAAMLLLMALLTLDSDEVDAAEGKEIEAVEEEEEEEEEEGETPSPPPLVSVVRSCCVLDGVARRWHTTPPPTVTELAGLGLSIMFSLSLLSLLSLLLLLLLLLVVVVVVVVLLMLPSTTPSPTPSTTPSSLNNSSSTSSSGILLWMLPRGESKDRIGALGRNASGS